MKAVIVHSSSTGRLALAEVPEPTIGEGEVLVVVRAAALSPAEVRRCNSSCAHALPEGSVPGASIAGVVRTVDSSVSGVNVGDHVMAMLSRGGYAERAVVSAGLTMPTPSDWTFETAAAVPEAFLLAHEALFHAASLQPGQTVLLSGVVSGVASAATQLARRRGAKVVAVANSSEESERWNALGAHVLHVATGAPVSNAFVPLFEDRPVDVVLSLPGGAQPGALRRCLSPGGTLVLLDGASSESASFELGELMSKRQRAVGATLSGGTESDHLRRVRRFLRDVLPALEEGKLLPSVNRIFPLAETVEAHDAMTHHYTGGAIILSLGQPAFS